MPSALVGGEKYFDHDLPILNPNFFLVQIAECAYRNMISSKKDNAMLITGESGAGKTENTKKVITYLALAASGAGKKVEKKVSLEDQIVATNPILESYGNAKTARNNNSSRFGKFIRIHFTAGGKLAGCDIVSYLLEKSRITEQQEVERSYHIFYQLLQEYGDQICPETLKGKCRLTNDIYDYVYVSQGKTKVDAIDDNEELEYTEDAFNVLGFSEQVEMTNIALRCHHASNQSGKVRLLHAYCWRDVQRRHRVQDEGPRRSGENKKRARNCIHALRPNVRTLARNRSLARLAFASASTHTTRSRRSANRGSRSELSG